MGGGPAGADAVATTIWRNATAEPLLTVDLSILLLVSCIVVPLGALLGAVSSALGYGLQWVAREVRQSLTPSTRGTARARPHAR